VRYRVSSSRATIFDTHTGTYSQLPLPDADPLIINLSFREAISVNAFLKGLKKALPKKYFYFNS